jgi:sigma-B regulation protein RsbU (phosphoserine phosphatase)
MPALVGPTAASDESCTTHFEFLYNTAATMRFHSGHAVRQTPIPKVMTTHDSPNQALLDEVTALRARVTELEAWNAEVERTAAAFIRSGETFRAIFDRSNDGIFIIDPEDDRIVDVNARAAEMLGYSVDELLRTPISAVHPYDMRKLRNFSCGALHNGPGWTGELACVARSGDVIPAEVSASIMELPRGRYVVALLRDIRERKVAEEELRRANERMRADLEAAAAIQRSLLPARGLAVRGLQVGWGFCPSETLAGDLLNVFNLDADHVGMYVLDVTGHGVRAAMYSLSLHQALSPYPGPTSLLFHQSDWETHEIVPPAEVATELARSFPFDPRTGRYVTLLYGILRRSTREFRFVSAGHPAPILVPPVGPIRELAHPGYPIGLAPQTPYEDVSIVLDPGSRLYLYTDGLVEARSPGGEMYDLDRLLDGLERQRARSLDESIGHALGTVKRWSGAERPGDDISLLGIELA